LSKRKIGQYLKNPDFNQIYKHGQAIAATIGLKTSADTFNPVIVDFYEQVGYLPDALVNYLLLLGWSLDDKTEFFSRREMIDLFSLERVNKAPASFDAKKLLAFQERYMQMVPAEKKIEMVWPYLRKAGLAAESPKAAPGSPVITKLRQILDAAGDRIKVAGDILDYADFFVPDDRLTYDEPAFEKRIRKPPEAKDLLRKFRERLAAGQPTDAKSFEKLVEDLVKSEGITLAQIVHALRVSVTGKGKGFGLFESMAILGQESCLARLNRALARE
jgi:glutamyl-tRNA synthetase